MPGDNSTRNGNGNGSHGNLNSNNNNNNNNNGNGSNSNSNGGNGGKQEQSQEIKNIDQEKERDKDKSKDEKKGGIKAVNGMESGRLIKLLQQAFAYQITQSMTSSLCTFEKQEVSVLVPVRSTTTGAAAAAATVVAGGGGGVGGGGGGVGGGVMVRSIEDSVRGGEVGGERGDGGEERAIIGGDKIERGETSTALTTMTTATTAAAAVVVQGVDDVTTAASAGLEKEKEKGMDGTTHIATTSSSTSTLALSSSSSSFSSALPVTDSTRLLLPTTEHSSLPPPTLPLSLPPALPLPLPLPLPLSEILPPHIPHTVNKNINTQGMGEGRGGWIDPVPRVHRLIEDFKPTVLPGTLTAILTVNPVSSIPYKYTQPSGNTHTDNQNTQYRDNYTVPQRNLGDIRCFSMLPASSTGTGSGLFPSYLAGNNSSTSEFQSQSNRKRNNRLTVVAGTDRGSLILWRVPSSLPPLHSEYETSSGVFDIAHPSFSQRLLSPSAILHLRKGDNVRVRRTYRSDDDDSTDLFPPKIRDVAVSSSTGTLGWFHSDSPSDSFLLVAAALSDGTIALVCAGDAVNDSDEGGLRNGRRGRERGREGDRDRDDSVNRRGISSNRARSQSRLNCFESDRRDDRDREYNDHSKPLYSFSQKRCYLETHEVSHTILPYFTFILIFMIF